MRAVWPLLLTLLATFAPRAPGLASARAAAPEPAAEAAPLSRWAPSRRELQQLVLEIAPQVEAAAGRPFLSPPVVELATSEELGQVLYREQVHLLARLSDMTPEEADEAARGTAGSASGAFVGKYGFLEKKLYVVSGGVLHALATRGVGPEQARPVIEVVLAHELTHALQDQYADLGAVVSGRPDGDAVMAVNCLVEGHAVYVHEQVGELRGHPAAVDLVAEIHGYDRHHLSESVASMSADPARFYTAYVYGLGRAFVAWHTERGGRGAIWDLLEAPPIASAMILAPDTYAPTVEPGWSEESRRELAQARARLGRRRWDGTDERVGDFDLREHLVDRCGDGALAGALRAGWRSRAIGDGPRGPLLGVEVQLLGFLDARSARAYVDRMRTNAEAQLHALLPPVASALAPDISGTVTTFDALDADVSARESIAIEIAGARQDLGTVWVARGPNVIQVVTMNHRVSDRQLARSLDRVFDTLE